METGEINKPATLTNVLHLCQTSLWLYRYFYLSIFQSKHNWRWRLWNQTERGPKEIGMLMPAKGRQRVNSSPPQQCALCSPWKTIATRSSRGNDIWGKYVALQPEETMSKKKNRHEVTDLIKGEKYTESRETGTQLEGRGRCEKLRTLRWGFAASLMETRSWNGCCPSSWLHCSEHRIQTREGPPPALLHTNEKLWDSYTLSHGTPRCLATDHRKKRGRLGMVEWSKQEGTRLSELGIQVLGRSLHCVSQLCTKHLLCDQWTQHCLWCGVDLRGKSWRLSTSNVYKQDNNTNKTSNRVLLTFVQVPSSSSPYVHVTWQGYNYSRYTILHSTFFNQVVLYKFFHTVLQVSKF